MCTFLMESSIDSASALQSKTGYSLDREVFQVPSGFLPCKGEVTWLCEGRVFCLIRILKVGMRMSSKVVGLTPIWPSSPCLNRSNWPAVVCLCQLISGSFQMEAACGIQVAELGCSVAEKPPVRRRAADNLMAKKSSLLPKLSCNNSFFVRPARLQGRCSSLSGRGATPSCTANHRTAVQVSQGGPCCEPIIRPL